MRTIPVQFAHPIEFYLRGNEDSLVYAIEANSADDREHETPVNKSRKTPFLDCHHVQMLYSKDRSSVQKYVTL
jgi:hypothetical protein